MKGVVIFTTLCKWGHSCTPEYFKWYVVVICIVGPHSSITRAFLDQIWWLFLFGLMISATWSGNCVGLYDGWLHLGASFLEWKKKFHNKIVQEAGEIGKIFSYYLPTTIFVGRHMNGILVLFSYSDTCCMRYCSGLKKYEMFSL